MFKRGLALACVSLSFASGQVDSTVISPEPDYADHASVASLPNGDLYAAWISYDQQGSDTLRLRRRTAAGWQETIDVIPAAGDYFKTALAATPDGTLWVAWAAQIGGNFDLYARALKSGRWSSVTRLTEDAAPDFNHRLLADRAGNLYLCWQSMRSGDSNIYLKTFDGKRWSAAIAITSHEAGDWEPDLALDSKGRLHIVYDTYRHGDYDVFLRIYDHGELSEEIPIADSENFEARASIAIDDRDRAWVAWDDQGPNWALDMPHWTRDAKSGDWGDPAPWAVPDPPGVSRSVSLRYTQNIGIAVYQKGRRWKPAGSIAEVLPPDPIGTLEIPKLSFDSNGGLWMFFRRWVRRNDNSGMMEVRPGGWQIFASSYNGNRWSAPVAFGKSVGSNDQRVAAVWENGRKAAVLFPADERLDPDTKAILPPSGRHGRIYLSSLEASTFDEPALAELPPGKTRPYRRTAWSDRRNPIAAAGKKLNLYWGDLHRHTEISFDGGYDGTFWDMYRYAIDVAELDFVATTDHYFGGAGKDGLATTYDWWRIQKAADLFHAPGSFIPLFGYERSLTWPYGHRNVINLYRGQTAYPDTLPESEQNANAPRQPDEQRLWKALRGQDVITIPHTIAGGGGTDWSYNDPALEPLLEIYQGCRLSYETKGAPRAAGGGRFDAGFAWSALAKGYKIGFIASSDHRSTHISYAAVYAEEPTREGIFRALQQRHAYAATDNIVVDVRLGDAIMGDAVITDQVPELHVAVRGTGPIHRIEIIKNNQYVYSLEPNRREVSFTYRDGDATPGEAYYYVRLQQQDGQMAWASPIWVDYRLSE